MIRSHGKHAALCGSGLFRDGGFTLFELLVAVVVFAILSMIAFAGFWSVQGVQQHVENKSKRLAELQMAFNILGRDLRQAIARPIRDDYGDPQPAFTGSSEGYGSLLEFTHAGLRNPTGQPRSHLERVAYGVIEGELRRASWWVLDRSQGLEPAETVLLENVKDLSLRFFDAQGQAQTQWPPLVAGTEAPPALPKAIEVTVKTDDWGELIRLYRVAGEQLVVATN